MNEMKLLYPGYNFMWGSWCCHAANSLQMDRLIQTEGFGKSLRVLVQFIVFACSVLPSL